LFEQLKNSISGLDFDILITFIIGIGIVFFGITDDVRDKTFRLKNIIILYISLSIVQIFFNQPISVIVLILLGYLAGGIIFIHDKKNELEKELNLIPLLVYYSYAWILLNKTYIWFLCCFTLILLNINNPLISKLYQIHFFSIDRDVLQVIIILIFMLYHYSIVAVSFFGFYNFDTALEKLNISLEKDIIQKDKESETIKQLYADVNEKMDLLSFLLFMEDKNMFNRNKPYVTIYTDLIRSKCSKERENHFPSINFNDKRKGFKKIIRFLRGCSTIEQQYLRQHILEPNSYRYKIRRSLLTSLYAEYFFKSICKRKSRTYTRNNRKNRKLANLLIPNLKYHFLVSYFIEILKNPVDAKQMISIMSQNSRVHSVLYERIYNEFINSLLLEKYKLKIKEARDSDYIFLLREDSIR